jgi:hypothetical protein
MKASPMHEVEQKKKSIPALSQSRHGDMACETLYVRKHVHGARIAESEPAARGILRRAAVPKRADCFQPLSIRRIKDQTYLHCARSKLEETKDNLRVAVYHRRFQLIGRNWRDLSRNSCTDLPRFHLFTRQKIQYPEIV